MEPSQPLQQLPLVEDVLVYSCGFLTHRQLKPVSQVNKQLNIAIAKHLFCTVYKDLLCLVSLTPGLHYRIYELDLGVSSPLSQVAKAIDDFKSAFLTRADLLQTHEIEGIEHLRVIELYLHKNFLCCLTKWKLLIH